MKHPTCIQYASQSVPNNNDVIFIFLDYSEFSISAQLELENVSADNAGTYICVASRRKSGISNKKSIVMKVQGKVTFNKKFIIMYSIAIILIDVSLKNSTSIK